MKICFSTLGCPDWHFPEIVSAAADLGYDGIEIRGVGKDVFAPDSPVFSGERLAASKAMIEKNGLSVFCLDTTCVLSLENGYSEDKMRRTVWLAKKIGAKAVRVLGDAAPEPGDVDEALVLKRLKEATAIAAEYGVTVIIETNGVYSDSKKLKSLIEAVGADNLGALWDIQHPYRVAGESMEETAKTLGGLIKHVHVKDSVVENGKTVYKMTGYGKLPIKEAVTALKGVGYEGALSLEWLKRWNRDLEEPGIVFAHYIRAMKAMVK